MKCEAKYPSTYFHIWQDISYTIRMAEDRKLVSIIVPVYNAQEYLSYCIKSLIAQSYQQLEIILVDDGSTDDSGKICDTYANQDSRIRVLHQKNSGISGAQNAGLDAATGDYIAFADNDDILDTHNIEYLVHALETTDADMSKARWEQFGVSDLNTVSQKASNGVHAPQSITVFTNPLRAYQTIFCKTFRILGEKMGRHTEALYFNEANWCRLYRREIWDNLRFPEGQYAQDTALSGLLYSRIRKVADINSVLYYWLQHSKSVTHKKQELPFYEDHISVSLNNIEICKQHSINPSRSLYTIVSNLIEQYKILHTIPQKDKKILLSTCTKLSVPQLFSSCIQILTRLAEKVVYDRVVKNIK